jgi:AcrR family transcriptional regulator
VTAPTRAARKRTPTLPATDGPAAASKGDLRRGEILTAARRILVDDGYDYLVLREVAARLGITLGNLQYYYPTRDDLLEAVIRAEFDRNRSDVAALAGAERPPRDRLGAIVRHLIDVWAKEGGRVYVVMSMLAIHHDRFARLHREMYESFYDGLVPVLAGIRPRATPAELRRTARLVTTLIDGALVQVPGRTFVADTVAAALEIAQRQKSLPTHE